jgi:hypothetical protein
MTLNLIKDSVDVQVALHFILYEVDGSERFHVYLKRDGEQELMDVTSEYEVMAASDQETGRSGLVLMKKTKEL